MCKSNQELKEKLYYFTITDEEIDKMSFLKNLCRQMANTVCRADAVSLPWIFFSFCCIHTVFHILMSIL